MTMRSRIGGVLMGLSLVAVMGLLPSLAQDAPASKAARRVPPYFSKVGLTDEQREKVYAIRARHQAKIEELKQQIEETQLKEMEECESVLAAPQKQLLEQLRSGAKTAKTRTRAKAAPAEAKGDAKSGD